MQKFEFALTSGILIFGWFLCAVSTNSMFYWFCPIYVGAFITFYFLAAKPPLALIKLMLCILLVGYTVDGLFKLFAVIAFSPSSMHIMIGQLPLSHVCVWLLFASTFHTLFRPLGNHYWLAGILGLIFGPLTYFAENQLGALQFPHDVYLSLTIIGSAWMAILPLLLKLTHRLIQWQPQTTIKPNR